MGESTVYGGGFAALYDLFQSAKNYNAEARFVRDAADEILGMRGKTLKVLDLACGTGSHAIALSGMKCDVTGVDVSRDMLALARRKASAAKRRIRFVQQDLASLDPVEGWAPSPTQPRRAGEGARPSTESGWDLVTCLFDSLGYLRSDARIQRALRRIHRATKPGGLVILEVWHAPAMLAGFDPLRVRRVRGRGIEAVRIGETRLRGEHLAEVRYEIFSRKGEGAWHRFVETHVNRFFTQSEIAGLVSRAGLRVVRVTGGYDAAAAPDDAAWHLVLIAQRGTESR
jgi:SAM-dependent methyltransferase